MSVLKDYYNLDSVPPASDDAAIEGSYGASRFLGQTFTASSDYAVASVKLRLYKKGTPGEVTFSIVDTVGGLPSGGDKAVGTINGNDLTADTAGLWVTITFVTPYSLTNGEKYAIVWKCLDGDVDNQIGIRRDTTFSSYAGGNQVWTTNGGTNWYNDALTKDCLFETYAEAVYADLAGTGGGIGGGSAALAVTTITDLVGTGGGVGGGSAALAVAGMPVGGAGVSRNYKRVVVASNDRIYYEDI